MMLQALLFLGMFSGNAHAMQTINNCSFWTYSFDNRGYICSGYPMSVQVAEGWETARALDEANRKIQDLEERVKKLEGGREQ